MNIAERVGRDGHPLRSAIREILVEPFIQATRTALGEMAGAEVVLLAESCRILDPESGEIGARIDLHGETAGQLILLFPQATAEAFCQKILLGANTRIDSNLLSDCVGELGNVIAGQAKAMLAETDKHFTFALPHSIDGGSNHFSEDKINSSVAVAFGSELGEFVLQLLYDRL